MAPPLPDRRRLDGRVALVTGVSRPVGIASTLAQRLHALGATVVATGWPPHDAEMPWGDQPLESLPFDVARHDLEDPLVPGALVDEVVELHGRIDVVAAVHARSSHHSLDEVGVDELDRCWATNVRSIVLLAQRFALDLVERARHPCAVFVHTLAADFARQHDELRRRILPPRVGGDSHLVT